MIRYPKGLNRTIALMKLAMYDIINSDEIDKVIKAADDEEKKQLKQLKKDAAGIAPSDMNIWAMLDYIRRCPDMLSDVITMTVMKDTEKLTEAELEELFKVK